MSGFWAMFWLVLVMKIPLVMLLSIVWWAIHQQPLPEGDLDEGQGGSPHDRGPRLHPPHPPRRGPHADPAPQPPERMRAHRARRPSVR